MVGGAAVRGHLLAAALGIVSGCSGASPEPAPDPEHESPEVAVDGPDSTEMAAARPPSARGSLAYVLERGEVRRTCIASLDGGPPDCPEALVGAYPAPPDPRGEVVLVLRAEEAEAGHREQLAAWAEGALRPLSDWAPAVRSPVWSRDGQTIAFVAGRPGATALFTVDRAAGEATERDAHPHGDFEPSLGPGDAVVFATSRDGQAEIYGLTEAGLVRGTEHPGSDASPAFSPTGERVAWLTDRGGRDRVWLGTGVGLEGAAPLGADDGSVHRGFAWSPDGKTLAVVASGPRGAPRIDMYRVEDGEKTGFITVNGAASSPAWSPDGRWLAFAVETAEGSEIRTAHRSGRDVKRVETGEGEAWLPRWLR